MKASAKKLKLFSEMIVVLGEIPKEGSKKKGKKGRKKERKKERKKKDTRDL